MLPTNGDDEPRSLTVSEDVTGGYDGDIPIGHDEDVSNAVSHAIIDDSDFCQDSKEERQTLDHQIRLSPRSSQQAICQKRGCGSGSQEQSTGKGKTRATESEVRDFFHPRPWGTSPFKEDEASPCNTTHPIKGRQFQLTPATQAGKSRHNPHPFQQEDFSLGSPELGTPIDRSSRAINASNQVNQTQANLHHYHAQPRVTAPLTPPARSGSQIPPLSRQGGRTSL